MKYIFLSILFCFFSPSLVLANNSSLPIDEDRKQSVKFIKDLLFKEDVTLDQAWSGVARWVGKHYIQSHQNEVSNFIIKMSAYNQRLIYNWSDNEEQLWLNKIDSGDLEAVKIMQDQSEALLGRLRNMIELYWIETGSLPLLTRDFMESIFYKFNPVGAKN